METTTDEQKAALEDEVTKTIEAVSLWPENEESLIEAFRTFVNQKHSYNTSAIAAARAMGVALGYISHHLGTTGFQALWAVLRAAQDVLDGLREVAHAPRESSDRAAGRDAMRGSFLVSLSVAMDFVRQVMPREEMP